MMELDQTYLLFKALGDESRMKIIVMLSRQELCACKILDQLSFSQPTLSHHMKILCDSGLVYSRKEGKWMHYGLQKETFFGLAEELQHLTQIPPLEGLPKITALQDNTKTNLYVLTGFLGSGKTTVLQNILQSLQTQRVGVIQNEFGKLSIDGTILRNDNLQMVEITRGSIFCSCLKLSFVEALAEMAKQNLQHIFVESSGLGDPSNVEEILGAVAVLAGDKYTFKGVICLVDGVNFLDQLDDLETVYRQLKHCNLAVITKVDLIDATQLEAVKAKIRNINPVCRICISSLGDLGFDFLTEDLMQYRWAQSEETTNTEETKPKTISLSFNGELEQPNFEKFLRNILEDTYRIKGFFKFNKIGWNQIDVVGTQIDYKPCEEKEESQLVFISKIGPAIIRKIANSWGEQTDKKMELKN